MAARFWKSTPAALKRPTLDELYKRLRDLNYTQVDQRMAAMLDAILQLEAQVECWESATEAVLMVGYTSEAIFNQEQTIWLSWNVDGGARRFDLTRNPGLSKNTEYGAGEFSFTTRPPVGPQQLEEGLDWAQREQDKASQDRDGAKLERDQASLERDQAILERDQAGRDLNMIRA